MTFEVFKYKYIPHGRPATRVTLCKDGNQLSMAKGAHDLMQNPRFVEVLCNPETKELALRPTTKGRKVSAFPRGGGQVTVTGLAKHYGLEAGTKYELVAEDGLFVLRNGRKY